MRKTVNGSDGFGTKRVYDFEILTAIDGLTLIHEYGSLLTAALPQIIEVVKAWEDTDAEDKVKELVTDDFVMGGGPVVDLIKLIPQIISTGRMIQLAKTFLTGATVDGQECDADGMCDIFRGRPHEVYAAIVHAVIANFPDYLPFLDSPAGTTDTRSEE